MITKLFYLHLNHSIKYFCHIIICFIFILFYWLFIVPVLSLQNWPHGHHRLSLWRWTWCPPSRSWAVISGRPWPVCERRIWSWSPPLHKSSWTAIDHSLFQISESEHAACGSWRENKNSVTFMLLTTGTWAIFPNNFHS